MATSQPRRPPTRETIEVKKGFTCEICTEPTPKIKKFKNKGVCTHPICQDCIAKYTETKIEDDETARIKCPRLDCEQLLEPVSCRDIIKPSAFSKWCDLLFEDYLLGFDKSFCPNKSCMALVVNECRRNHYRQKKSKCPQCRRYFCFQCKLAWHAGHYECEESKNIKDPNDILHGKLAEKMRWAKCPRCGHCVNVNPEEQSHTIDCRF